MDILRTIFSHFFISIIAKKPHCSLLRNWVLLTLYYGTCQMFPSVQSRGRADSRLPPHLCAFYRSNRLEGFLIWGLGFGCSSSYFLTATIWRAVCFHPDWHSCSKCPFLLNMVWFASLIAMIGRSFAHFIFWNIYVKWQSCNLNF